MIDFYTWGLGLFLFALEGVLLNALGFDGVALQMPIALTLVLAFEREFVPASLVLAFWLLPVEWLVSGPPGHYGLGLVTIYFIARLVGPSIQGGWGIPRLVAAFVATLLHGLVVAASFLVVDPSSAIGRAVLWELLPSAVITAITALVVGMAVARVDDRLFPERKKRGLQM